MRSINRNMMLLQQFLPATFIESQTSSSFSSRTVPRHLVAHPHSRQDYHRAISASLQPPRDWKTT